MNFFEKIYFLWREEWDGVIVLGTIQQVKLKFKSNNKNFLISAMYARCNIVERLELLKDLESMVDSCQCLGSLGEILM